MWIIHEGDGTNDAGDGGEATGPSEEVVREAREMGWVAKEEFKGDPEKWVDAEEFVERGKHILPILLENNKRMKRELLTRDQQIDKLRQSVESSQLAIAELRKVNTEATKRAVEAAIKRTKDELKAAVEDRDVERELELRDQLTDLQQAKKDADAKPVEAPPKEPKEEKLSPDFVAWRTANEWFLDESTPEARKRIKAAVRLAEDIKEEHPELSGKAFFDKLDEELAKTNKPTSNGRPVGKVDTGGGRSVASSGKKGYADMPKEAREACDNFIPQLVGEGKAFKDEASWRAEYAKTFFEGEQ